MKKTVFVVMGVSGCGKTTIGKLLSEHLNVPFFEGDKFHPIENVQKMENGIPLDDTDREPWLNKLNDVIGEANLKNGGVLSCSALKEAYRKVLSRGNRVKYVYLKVSEETAKQRLDHRKDHFMPVSLLESQFKTLEEPVQSITINAGHSTDQVMEKVIESLNNEQSDIAVIGLGVMGSSLARNFSDHGFRVSIFDVLGKFKKGQDFTYRYPDKSFYPAVDFADVVRSLKRPRKVLLMITAGEPVEQVISSLIPLLDPEDIIVDAGNSHFQDSEKRFQQCKVKGIEFIGLGVSGGEEGALNGPSLMMGASDSAKESVLSLFQAIAAKDRRNRPCMTHAGAGGAGHFVKMVHNGIEYAEMQLIAESYSLLKWAAGLENDNIAKVFSEWNKELHESYLLGISVEILQHRSNDAHTLDTILDAADNKGTGRWVIESALELGVPVPAMEQALTARFLSSLKEERKQLNSDFSIEFRVSNNINHLISDLKESLFISRLLNHVQGLRLIIAASEKYSWDMDLIDVLQAWKGGCIIRSELLYVLTQALEEHDFSKPIISNNELRTFIERGYSSLITILHESLNCNIPLPVFSSTHTYLLSVINNWSSANLVQAQRDYFGAHGYRKIDDEDGAYHHTQWKE